MSRRSCRLASTGYYNSDDESDSSSVTNISYRENPVKVFKKKAGTRKAVSRASTSSSSFQSPSTKGRKPSLSTQTDLTMGSVSYTRVTPRPPLIPASSTTTQTPTRCPPPPPERIRGSGQAVVYLRPDQEKSCVDSSGYSSSEGVNLKSPTASTTAKSSASTSTSTSTSTSKAKSNPLAPPAECRRQINSALCRVKETLSTLTAKINHLTTLGAQVWSEPLVYFQWLYPTNANRHFISAQTKTTCIALILLFLLVAFVWFLPPLLTPLHTLTDFIKAQSPPAKVTQRPVLPNRPSPLDNVQYTTATDSGTLPTEMEAKVQHLQEALQQKQELLDKMRAQFEADVQNIWDHVKGVESSSAQNLDHEVNVLIKKIDDQQEQSISRLNDHEEQSISRLNGRIKALETKIVELSRDLLSSQSQPGLPCPNISSPRQLTPELQQAMEKWLTDRIQAHNAVNLEDKGISACAQPLANKMADFALETQGASVISTRCSETYRTRSACLSLFGFPLWYPMESPRTVIRGEPMLLPGKCWAFHGAHGTLVIALSHPIRITHVTLDHVPHHNTPTGRIDSAPKDFEVYGLKDEVDEGTLLGTFTYNEDGEPTQTFELPPSNVIYRVVELRVLSNWGHMDYTCLYRFRVHGTLATDT
ncbi:uncharacterized protein LOC119120472 isoform X2 [Syngnathus acus]|nr:uncharacterized protein LOC119120472 isoform X2 [Syngnathus acus]XP_037103293.1 uncharacterized protein LOC119120472 isoform X2 [Syngnathus acus]XP_037103302.1 uncharacterized protein LOC119120472 isoform X2 [Syngnathus acus]XP_037103313.1 uncharacterized protein LOC119120472 isoform X2 [Syngnathus acus]XP_037103322.1 uncharacterized protein LOC119120472 isoform X2 [Syngnathus acus]XP_037103331.1 uncharacterized protein LOC119120472 isoform X2 [Syngnathus acus]